MIALKIEFLTSILTLQKQDNKAVSFGNCKHFTNSRSFDKKDLSSSLVEVDLLY